jgi:ribonuclease Z
MQKLGIVAVLKDTGQLFRFGRLGMKACSNAVAGLFAGAWLVTSGWVADAAPCLIVTLTGTHGGPQLPFNGQASAGTLVRYGDETDNCAAVKLQFDAGRGTTMRLSQIGIGTEQLNAVFFTHMHNDHTDGFADLVQSRWAFHGTGTKIDAICSADIASPQVSF